MAHAADDTRHRLLEAAGEVFADKGFPAATIREICSRAGANLAAVNYHFGDKQHLYVAAVKHAHTSGPQQPPATLPRDMPPDAKLRIYIRHMLTRMFDSSRPLWHAQLLSREMIQPTDACAEMVEAFIRRNFELLCSILTEIMPEQTTTEQLHLAASSIVGQCLHFKISHPVIELLVGREEADRYDIDRLTDHITRFSLAALGCRPSAVGAETPSSEVAQP